MKIFSFALSLLLSSTSLAAAGIIQITSVSQLGPHDTVNWDTFGPVPSVVSTYAEEPAGPLIVHINTASGELAIRPGSDVGGFLLSDTLLSQLPGNLSDPILVGFSTPIKGLGTQIESLLPGAFTGYMDLYDSGGNPLGEVSVNANTGDPTAPFIGAISSTSDIDYVIFSVNNGNPEFPKAGDVAINSVNFAVPEPLTVSLFGMGVTGLAVIRRHRRKT